MKSTKRTGETRFIRSAKPSKTRRTSSLFRNLSLFDLFFFLNSSFFCVGAFRWLKTFLLVRMRLEAKLSCPVSHFFSFTWRPPTSTAAPPLRQTRGRKKEPRRFRICISSSFMRNWLTGKKNRQRSGKKPGATRQNVPPDLIIQNQPIAIKLDFQCY